MLLVSNDYENRPEHVLRTVRSVTAIHLTEVRTEDFLVALVGALEDSGALSHRAILKLFPKWRAAGDVEMAEYERETA